MTTYKVVRMYKDSWVHRTVKKGLSLKEAQLWCKNPETSSSTCAEIENIEHTRKHGPWFDGYEEEQ